jgi:hypothetical protein
MVSYSQNVQAVHCLKTTVYCQDAIGYPSGNKQQDSV